MKAGVLVGHLDNNGNEGSIIRTAESFGLNNIFVIGNKKEYSTSQGADKHCNFYNCLTEVDFIDYCRTHNLHIVALENINTAKDIMGVYDLTVKIPSNPVFVTGNEKKGVPKDILDNAKLVIKISQAPTYVRCLNTAVAVSILIHAFYIQRLKTRDISWGLDKK